MNPKAFPLAELAGQPQSPPEAAFHSASGGELPITSESDIIATRQAVRNAAAALGFGLIDVTRIVTAASELTRNIYVYAGSGIVRWRSVAKAGLVGLELTFEDHGPGIPDVQKAMEPGFTTGRGMGLGLPGSKRLMDEMTIQSAAGQGTTIEIRKWLR
jgi:serine/threonine-protein kinase RsbT